MEFDLIPFSKPHSFPDFQAPSARCMEVEKQNVKYIPTPGPSVVVL